MSSFIHWLHRLNTRTTAWVILLLIILGWTYTIATGYQWADRIREQVRQGQNGPATLVEIYSVRDGDFYNPAHWLAPPTTLLVYDQSALTRTFPTPANAPKIVLAGLSTIQIDDGWNHQLRLYNCSDQTLTLIGRNEKMPETLVEFLRDTRREWIPLQALPDDQPIHQYYCPD
jgi:hypothetical protein